MKGWKRVWFYLILNILVSACTMFVVLQLWIRFNRTPVAIPQVSFPDQPTLVPIPTATELPPLPPTANIAYEVYQVQAGDTLGAIALQFDLSVDELMDVNGLTNPDDLGDGQVLLIPLTPTPEGVEGTPISASQPAETEASTPPGTETASLVKIVTIVGAGVLPDERVEIRHIGEDELPMENWKLEDGDGNVYTFPRLTLYQGGAVSVYTKAGGNSVVELYWERTEPVWEEGETAILRDPQGNVRASYQVP